MKWPWIKRAQQQGFTNQSAAAVIGSTVMRAEELRRMYSRDPEAIELIARAKNTVHSCAIINARACAGQTIRLYRKEKAGKRAGTRAIDPVTRKAIARGVMGTKAQSFVDSGDDVVEVMDHEALDFVRRPNPLFPGTTIEFMRFYFAGITGRFYSIVTDDQMGKLQWPGYPQFVYPVYDKANFIAGYYFGRDQTDVIPIDPEQVIHYRNNPSRTNPLQGEGDFAGVVPEADLIDATLMHDIAMAQNGQRPDSMIKVSSDSPLTKEQMQAMYDSLDQWKSGGAREGKPFIGQNLDWIPLAFNPKDLQTVEQLEMYRKQIHFAAGVPESMVDSNASTYASSLIADAQHGRVIRHKLADDGAQKTETIMPMFGLDPTEWCFVYDDPVPRDEQAEVAKFRQLTDGGVLTINEVRAELGYEQAPDPMAEKLLFNGQPLGATAQPPSPFGGLFGAGPARTQQDKPEPPTEGDDDDTDPTPDPAPPGGETAEDSPEAEKEAPMDAMTTKADFQSEPANESPVSLSKHAMEAEGERWSGPECPVCGKEPTEDFPPGVTRDLYRQFGADFQADFEAILADAQDEMIRAEFNGSAADVAGLRDQAGKLLTEQITQIASESIRSELALSGALDDAFSVVNERALKFSREYSIRLVDDVFGTTAEIAKRAVNAGLEQGMSVEKVMAEMEGVPAYRAEVIARTELSRASHESRYETAKEAGATTSEWLTSPGHSVAHGMIAQRSPKPIGEPYVKAGEVLAGERFKVNIDKPPARPNCHCTIVFNYPGGDE